MIIEFVKPRECQRISGSRLNNCVCPCYWSGFCFSISTSAIFVILCLRQVAGSPFEEKNRMHEKFHEQVFKFLSQMEDKNPHVFDKIYHYQRFKLLSDHGSNRWRASNAGSGKLMKAPFKVYSTIFCPVLILQGKLYIHVCLCFCSNILGTLDRIIKLFSFWHRNSFKVMESLNNQKENLKQSVKKWNSEKSANEEYIAQVE